jgi:hypothetical protein
MPTEVAPRPLVHTSPSLTQHPVCFVLPCEVSSFATKEAGCRRNFLLEAFSVRHTQPECATNQAHAGLSSQGFDLRAQREPLRL